MSADAVHFSVTLRFVGCVYLLQSGTYSWSPK